MNVLRRLRIRRPTRRQAILGGIAIVVLLGIVFMFLPDAVPVQTAAVGEGPLQVIVEEEGQTRVVDRYVITSPVAAFARRIDLEVGDAVTAGQPVVRLEPPRATILDPRAQTEAAARVAAARASLGQADVAAAQATAELERVERLHAAGAATRQTLEQTTAEAARAMGARDAARAELRAAQAAQPTATGAGRLPAEESIRAPASGRVLAVHVRSEGHIQPGEPLIEVGNTEQLQIEADVLSQDAVRIGPGARVLLEQWGGDHALEAVVSQVDPQGFTRVSALGVEERRVRVIADITSPQELYPRLGPGYRVLARFVVWEQPNVLQVPSASLFRHGDGWAVFVVEGGRARLRTVTIGQQAGLATQVVEGLHPGEVVIVHPGNDVEDGVRVSGE
jgi:HlyD family secretion protein